MCLTPPPLKISPQPRGRQAPLCLRPHYFHSLSLALAKRIINGNHMCIGCHTCLSVIYHPPLPGTQGKPNIWLWLVPRFGSRFLFSHRVWKALRTKNDIREQTSPRCAGAGLESCHNSKWGATFSNVHLQNTGWLNPVYSVIWPHTPLCPASTHDVVCKPLRSGLLKKTHFYPLRP